MSDLKDGAVIAVRLSTGATTRTYSLRRVPRWLHWLAIELLTWRIAVVEVARKYRADREDLRARWDQR